MNSKYIKRYEDLGYDIPKYKDKQGRMCVKKGTSINVKIEDLSPTSRAKIKIKCDICGDVFERTYMSYNRSHSIGKKDYCSKCKSIGQQKTNIEKYGVPHVLQNKEILQKAKDTMLKRYGVENASQSPELKKKQEESLYKHYKTTTPCKNKEIQQRVVQTNISKYGVDYPLRLEEIKEKTRETWKNKYGGLKEFYSYQAEKAKQTKANKVSNYDANENKSIPISRQQEYLHKLFGGELNYPVWYYYVDIYLSDDKLCIEYDGGGHDLSVKLGRYTEEEFLHKQIVRDNIIKSRDIRIIRIISPTDKLPSDEILLQMRDNALEFFNTTNHTWRNYYIEFGIMKDAEHKDGAKYDYGKLWNAKILANKNKSA